MRKSVRQLAFAAALGAAGVAGTRLLGEKPPPVAADKPAAATTFAVDPKPLSDSVKKGLKFLADRQNSDGGWSQGGGWRTGGQGGGRVDDAADPSDVGNTCVALLALIRAGNTPQSGEYKDHVRKGLRFVCDRVEKADGKDLYITDVRNTQLQSKIGPFVDTFLTALVLSESKGKGGGEEKQLVAALDKTLDKMAKNQKDDGTFAGNGGWAPVLSQGIANKAIARAKQNGVAVRDEVLARAGKQAEMALQGAGRPVDVAAAPAAATADGRALGRPAGAFAGGGGVGDAGVALYGLSQGAGNLQDAVNGINVDATKAREVLRDDKASKEQKAEATKKVAEADRLNVANEAGRQQITANAKNQAFVNGFGSNGGEEFLSFLNISEMLIVKADQEWADWDGKMRDMLPKAQDGDGGWSGHHCITGKTFCTAGALLVLMADRTPFPADVLKAAREVTVKGEVKPEKK
jgi:CRISPR/Cas system CSM-associated protein Csm2 small subunit